MSLFRQLVAFFAGAENAADLREEEHPLLGRVALLLEAATYDDDFSSEERRKITSLLTGNYGLDQEEVPALMELARKVAYAATDLYSLTRDLAKHMSIAERRELMTELWQVILADGVIHQNEELFARKMQKLLRLDHPTWIAARTEARARGA